MDFDEIYTIERTYLGLMHTIAIRGSQCMTKRAWDLLTPEQRINQIYEKGIEVMERRTIYNIRDSLGELLAIVDDDHQAAS